VNAFTTFIVRPIFNLLVAIYALIPGHNFGLAIIIFTIIIRLLLWPLLKKQLHQARIMRELQPELKKIKAASKGNRQQEAIMVQELYKERGINPFSSIGVMLLQLPILIGLYSGLRRVVDDPHQLVTFSYPFLQHLPWMQHIEANIHSFDGTLFGVVDLTRAALGPAGVYWPAMLIVVASSIVQYFQGKQLMATSKDAKGLRTILKEAGSGKQADQADINAAVGKSTQFLLPVMIFFFTVNLASALSLYWLVGGIVAFIQQTIVLREDTVEMEALADAKGKGTKKQLAKSNTKNVNEIAEAEVVREAGSGKPKSKKKKSSSKKHKRRK
jgi:YidC/Oxa1 family membrane protein insertase